MQDDKMAESKYHKRIKDFILNYGKDYPKKYINSFLGSKNPILMHHPKKRKSYSIQYEPDIYFIKSRNKNKIIFEVLDSELKNSAEIISDIIRCCLCPNTDFLFFIIPLEEDDEENRISDMFDILKDTLINLGVDKRLMPELGVYYILKKESISYKKVKKILDELAQQDKW